jgi:hypothetical protein
MVHTLVLSAGYEPIKVVPWQRAITLLTLGKVEVLEEYDRDVRSRTIVGRARQRGVRGSQRLHPGWVMQRAG